MHLVINEMNFFDNGSLRINDNIGTTLICEAVYKDEDYYDFTHIKIGDYFTYVDKYRFEVEKIKVIDGSVLYTLKEKPLNANFSNNNFYKHVVSYKNSLTSIIGDRLK